MDIIIGKTTISTTADQDSGIALSAGDMGAEAYLVARFTSILNENAQKVIDKAADDARTALLSATPEERAAVLTAVAPITARLDAAAADAKATADAISAQQSVDLAAQQAAAPQTLTP